MSALGETFRTARESQGLSLSDVADRIHIRAGYLAAIEAEDWQTIGPAVYVRGFIRSYARFLGLDPDAAIARFGGASASGVPAPAVILAPSPRGEPSRSGLPRGEPQRSGRSREDPSRSRRSRREVARGRPSIWAVLGTVVALGLVAFAGYEYYEYARADAHHVRHPLADAPAGSAQPGGPALGPESTGAKSLTPESPGSAKNGDRSSGFAVRLRDSSWVRVVIDGKVTMEGVYPAGTERSFLGRAATVRVGNAGGVDVSVGGKDLGPMGGVGDVAERSFQL